jgi:hypothetical protein
MSGRPTSCAHRRTLRPAHHRSGGDWNEWAPVMFVIGYGWPSAWRCEANLTTESKIEGWSNYQKKSLSSNVCRSFPLMLNGPLVLTSVSSTEGDLRSAAHTARHSAKSRSSCWPSRQDP